MAEAAAALGAAPRRVFLTVGRLELAAFAAAPQHHYLVRTIEPIGDALPVPRADRAPGPRPVRRSRRARAAARARHRILVTKNSGGAATYGKIAAARALGLPVVMVARPEKPDGVATVDDADGGARLARGVMPGLASDAACRRRAGARRAQSRVVEAPMRTSVAMSAAPVRLGEGADVDAPRPRGRPRARKSPASRGPRAARRELEAPRRAARAGRDEIGL